MVLHSVVSALNTNTLKLEPGWGGKLGFSSQATRTCASRDNGFLQICEAP